MGTVARVSHLHSKEWLGNQTYYPSDGEVLSGNTPGTSRLLRRESFKSSPHNKQPSVCEVFFSVHQQLRLHPGGDLWALVGVHYAFVLCTCCNNVGNCPNLLQIVFSDEVAMATGITGIFKAPRRERVNSRLIEHLHKIAIAYFTS